jgi:hypothetical protein
MTMTTWMKRFHLDDVENKNVVCIMDEILTPE